MIRIETQPELDIETQAALAAGRSDPGVALLVETALEMRGAGNLAADAIAAATFESEAPAPMRADALDRALAAIDAADGPDKRYSAPADAAHELIRIPESLKRRIEEAEERRGWKAQAGLIALDLDLGGDCKVEIMRIPASGGVPRHTHRGQELTLCLSGGFSDGIASYGPGDVSVTDPSITHRPVADADGPCYVLAVTDAGLKFTGMLGLLQKIFSR